MKRNLAALSLIVLLATAPGLGAAAENPALPQSSTSGTPAAPARAAVSSSVRDAVMAALRSVTNRIDAIEVYGVPVNVERRFSYGIQKNRWHLFIRFCSGTQSGWTEMNIGPGPAQAPLEKRARRLEWFGRLKGLTPAEAIELLHAGQNKLGRAELEAAEMAILDLGGRWLNRPAAEILTLTATNPIPGLFCILSDEPETVKTEARRSLEQNLRTHLKVKLYGNTNTDCAVVRAAREVMGPAAYLGGDVNMGYRRAASDAPVDDLVAALLALRAAGLDACEDPGQMSNAQWSEVQRRVGDLALIPDEPMRPAWKSKTTMDPAMGRIYNMHPNCMGSLIETAELGRVIQRAGKKLMVGDASLVGPACAAWQQIAIGLGADWVEALEKPQESDLFQRCVVRQPVARTPDGRFMVRERLPGFGIEIDVRKLKAMSAGVVALGLQPVPHQ
jgi:L-alanine-DL-glutamate epimerase-like enolase superfamily enzyme